MGLRLQARNTIKGEFGSVAGEPVLVNAGFLLYILRFPVYNKEGGYNNFTSARSWPVITLSIWEALLLCTRPPHSPWGVSTPTPVSFYIQPS